MKPIETPLPAKSGAEEQTTQLPNPLDTRVSQSPATTSDGAARFFITLFFVLFSLLMFFAALKQAQLAKSTSEGFQWWSIALASLAIPFLLYFFYHQALLFMAIAMGLTGMVRGAMQLTVPSLFWLTLACTLFAAPFLVDRFVFRRRTPPPFVEGAGVCLVLIAGAIFWQFEEEGLMFVASLLVLWILSFCFRSTTGKSRIQPYSSRSPNSSFEDGTAQGPQPNSMSNSVSPRRKGK